MKANLLHKEDGNFDWQLVRSAAEQRAINRRGWGRRDEYFDEHAGLPWNEEDLTADLALDTLFKAMAGKDDCIYEASRRIVLEGVSGDIETIKYRQAVLQDCLKHPTIVRKLYVLANEALEKEKEHWISDYTREHPDSLLRESIGLLNDLLGSLKQLREIANTQASKFNSEGWMQLFAMLKRDLDDEYLASVEHHLKQLELRHESLLLSAKLSIANKGSQYLLHQAPQVQSKKRWAWTKSLLKKKAPVYAFRIHPRDYSGGQALGELRNRGIGSVAGALGQSADSVRDFFDMLQIELAFYVGCLNLHKKLENKREPTSIPSPVTAEKQRLSFHGLYDVGLALTVDKRVVGNDVNANGKNLVIITGANTGGKSTFLRSVGLAQLMMQAGMFVPAKSFSSSLCNGLFTHYKREEDTEMESGKFDEELSRMSDIVDHIKPNSMILFNESFAATNEREGSEIARQIITALLEKGIKVVCVTHLYEFANSFYARGRKNTLFLRAGLKAGGVRTFKMVEGVPLPTIRGEDLYKKIFATKNENSRV